MYFKNFAGLVLSLTCFLASASDGIQVINEPLKLNDKVYFAVLGSEFDGDVDSLTLCENLGKDYVSLDLKQQRELFLPLNQLEPLRSQPNAKLYTTHIKNGDIRHYLVMKAWRYRASRVGPTRHVDQLGGAIPVCFSENPLDEVLAAVDNYSPTSLPEPVAPAEIEEVKKPEISSEEVAQRARTHSFDDFALGGQLTKEPSCVLGGAQRVCHVEYTKPFSYLDTKAPYTKEISSLEPQQRLALKEMFTEKGYEDYVSSTRYYGYGASAGSIGLVYPHFKGDWVPVNVTVNSENEITSYQILKFYDASYTQIRNAIEDIYGPIMQDSNFVAATYEDVELMIRLTEIENDISLTISAKSLTNYDQSTMKKNKDIKIFFENKIAELQAELEQQNKKSISL